MVQKNLTLIDQTHYCSLYFQYHSSLKKLYKFIFNVSSGIKAHMNYRKGTYIKIILFYFLLESNKSSISFVP